MSGYFFDFDANMELSLWRGEPGDPAPVQVLTRWELRDDLPVWRALVDAFGGDS